MNDFRPLLKLKVVAERLGYSEKTVRRLIADRKLKAFRLSNRAWRVEAQEVDRFLELRGTTLRSTEVSTPLRFRPKVSNG